MFNLNASGRLTADPVLTFHKDVALCEMSIATSRYTGKNEDGTPRLVSDYLDIKVWGKMAETHATHLTKGSYIVATGPLVHERWEKDGTNRSKHILQGDNLEYVQKPAEAAGDKVDF